MNKEQELQLLNKEVAYLEAEYLKKQGENRRDSVIRAISSLKDIFRENECDFITDQPLELSVSKNNNACIIQCEIDYLKEPKKPRQFNIEVNNKEDVLLKMLVRLFMDESVLPEPDLNRLLTNPYEGMKDMTEVEIFERKKSVDSMKKYINEPENLKWNFLSVDVLNESKQEMFKTAHELFQKGVNFGFEKINNLKWKPLGF